MNSSFIIVHTAERARHETEALLQVYFGSAEWEPLWVHVGQTLPRPPRALICVFGWVRSGPAVVSPGLGLG